MKEELLNKLIEKSLQYLNTAEAFTIKEVPIFVQELLEFKFVEHLVAGLSDSVVPATVIVLIIGAFVLAILLDSDKKLKIVPTILSFGVGFVLMFSIFLAGNQDHFIKAYKAKYAPRVYLMDYARGLK